MAKKVNQPPPAGGRKPPSLRDLVDRVVYYPRAGRALVYLSAIPEPLDDLAAVAASLDPLCMSVQTYLQEKPHTLYLRQPDGGWRIDRTHQAVKGAPAGGARLGDIELPPR